MARQRGILLRLAPHQGHHDRRRRSTMPLRVDRVQGRHKALRRRPRPATSPSWTPRPRRSPVRFRSATNRCPPSRWSPATEPPCWSPPRGRGWPRRPRTGQVLTAVDTPASATIRTPIQLTTLPRRSTGLRHRSAARRYIRHLPGSADTAPVRERAVTSIAANRTGVVTVDGRPTPTPTATLSPTPPRPTKGTVVVNPNGTFTYTPTAAARHAAGAAAPATPTTDTFTVTVDDGRRGTVTVTVTVGHRCRPTTAPTTKTICGQTRIRPPASSPARSPPPTRTRTP